jgi:hypothetical protein
MNDGLSFPQLGPLPSLGRSARRALPGEHARPMSAAVKSMQGACPGRSHFLKLTHASVPSGLKDEGSPDDKESDQ